MSFNIILVGMFLAMSMQASISGAETIKETKLRLLETQPSGRLSEKLDNFWKQASTINIKYTPSMDMGRIWYDRRAAQEQWKYRFEYRCTYSCSGSLRTLKRQLATGLRTSGRCPTPIEEVIELQNDQIVLIGSIYIDSSGHCFTLDDESFVTRGVSLLEAIKSSVSWAE